MGGPCYRGWRLDRSLAEFHRAVDRLRWATATPERTSRTKPKRTGEFNDEPNF